MGRVRPQRGLEPPVCATHPGARRGALDNGVDQVMCRLSASIQLGAGDDGKSGTRKR